MEQVKNFVGVCVHLFVGWGAGSRSSGRRDLKSSYHSGSNSIVKGTSRGKQLLVISDNDSGSSSFIASSSQNHWHGVGSSSRRDWVVVGAVGSMWLQ
jgi:hypothetical protein